MKRYSLFLVAMAAVFSPWLLVRADEAKPGAAAKPAEVEQVVVEAAPGYWIGLMGEPISPLLKSHLKLESGIVVMHVMPDSPAAKAGLQENDVLLKFGDTMAKDLESLSKAVADAMEHGTTVTILRAGQEKQLKITPAKRPEHTATARLPKQAGEHAEWEKIAEMLKRMEKDELGEMPLRAWMMRPGMVLPKELGPDALGLRIPAVTLPSGTSVMIEKDGDGPTKITVKRGEQSWTVTEDKINDLPEDLRGPVQAMLGKPHGVSVLGLGELNFEVHPQSVPGANPGAAAAPQAVRPGGGVRVRALPAPGNAENHPLLERLERLEEMNRRAREHEKQLQKQLDDLRKEIESLKKADA